MNILLTYFEPFAGRDINNSRLVAEHLQKIGQTESIFFLLQELPVIYDLAAHKAISFFNKHAAQSHLAVSLGECNDLIRIETLFRNRDHTPELADNANTLRFDHQIFMEAPSYIESSLPVQKMKEQLSQNEQQNVIISEDAGSFVCNNTAFTICYKKIDLPYTFIHVPHANNIDVPSPNECAHIILKMLKYLKK